MTEEKITVLLSVKTLGLPWGDPIATPDGGDDPLDIDLVLDGHGWASMTLTSGSRSHKIKSISYTTDALGDLIRTALMSATGAIVAEVAFDNEPILSGIAVGKSWLLVRTMDGTSSASIPPVVTWERTEFEIYPCGDTFAKAVEAAANAILDQYGEAGYQERWERPFPMKALLVLRAALAA